MDLAAGHILVGRLRRGRLFRRRALAGSAVEHGVRSTGLVWEIGRDYVGVDGAAFDSFRGGGLVGFDVAHGWCSFMPRGVAAGSYSFPNCFHGSITTLSVP